LQRFLVWLLIGVAFAPAATARAVDVNDLAALHSDEYPGSCEPYTRLIEHYRHWKGVPYRFGGNGRAGIDCSAYVRRAVGETMGLTLPRSAAAMKSMGTPVGRRDLAIGDLVFFKTGPRRQHVGIYIGNREFIHASRKKGVVKSSLETRYWSRRYEMAVRLKPAEELQVFDPGNIHPTVLYELTWRPPPQTAASDPPIEPPL
jgi:cell wall-associated NlpC family hydrolase